MKRICIVFPLLIIFLAMAGCGLIPIAGEEDPPELIRDKEYMTARKEFALTLQMYNDYYARADDATKAKWKKNIDPLFKKADKALDSWKMAIDQGFTPDSQEQLYLTLKSDLLLALVEVFGVKEN